MSTPGEAENIYGRWPDDDRRKGRRRRDVQAAAARGLRQGRDQMTELIGGTGRAMGDGHAGHRGGEGERAMVPPA